MNYLFPCDGAACSIYYIYILNIALLLCSFVLGIFWLRSCIRIRKIQKEHEQNIGILEAEFEKKKASSANTQRSVIKGQVGEEMAPILPGMPYLPSDMHFSGQPIDYIIFRGLSEARADDEIQEIIIADVKVGKAQLSDVQKKIKAAVQAGRVRWETIRIEPKTWRITVE